MPGCWECVEATGQTLFVAIRMHAQYRSNVALNAIDLRTALFNYGHLHEHVERLHSCAKSLVKGETQQPLRLLLPATYNGKAIFQELAVLLNGSALIIERVAIDGNATILGLPSGSCCVGNNSALLRARLPAGTRVAQMSLQFHHSSSASTKRELRTTVWQNLGLLNVTVDTVLLVRAQGSNGRRLKGELQLAERIRSFVSTEWPSLRFEWADISAMPYREEISLLRRSAVLISLYGSSLHNCRWLPPEAVVIEIHGALQTQWRDSGYAWLCASEMGLRWVAVAADNALPLPSPPTVGSETSTAGATARRVNVTRPAEPWPSFHAHKYYRDSSSTARVNVTRLLDVLRKAMRGDWHGAIASYPLRVFGFLSRDEWLDAVQKGGSKRTAPHTTVSSLLKLPQYRAAIAPPLPWSPHPAR